jgi:hypothetical protein
MPQLLEPPLSLTVDGERFYRRDWNGDLNGKDERILIWGSEESISVLRQNGQIFIDGTFCIVPRDFYQCVVIMAFDPTVALYVPCIWSLLSGKSELQYCTFLHEVVVLLDYRWSPKVCVVDFERGLIGAVNYEFTKTKIVGCFFHFKQALYRKMKKMKLPEDEMCICLQNMGFLTVIPKEEIEIAISFLELLLPDSSYWKMFWKYFRNTWMVRFSPTLWKSSEVGIEEMERRTNNALERYNRRLNERFSTAHPNIGTFIEGLRNEEMYFVSPSKNIGKCVD